ncbi:MAG: tetratricopeptide repeat protein [Treponema sp.]
MSLSNPLESVYFITLPDDFKLSEYALKIDKTVPLPVQKKSGESNPDIKSLEPEQILAGILTVLAYDRHNAYLDYYRSIIKKARPDLQRELTEAAILKSKDEDWELAEELFMTLRGLDPENPVTALNTAIFLDQRAESYRKSNLNEDADAYDNDAFKYYKEAMNAEPPLPDAFFNCGFFHLKQYDFREAKSCFETYVALTCDATDDELGENGIYKKERAQELVDRINNENLEDKAFITAYKLISGGQEEKGLKEIRSFLEKNQKVWNAWFLLGWGLRKLCRWEDAKQAFEESIVCGGNDNADTHNELAICLMETGNLSGAKSELLKALSLAPENEKIISNLGYLSLKEGKRDEAQKYFAAVLEYCPNDKIAAAELAKLEAGI